LEGDRDRDAAGRARNARPRDAAGRPLPYGSPGVPRVPDDLLLEPDDALAEAQRLLDEGHPFQAHEVLEGAWKAAAAAGSAEAPLWQGLAQLAVGLTHRQRGNAVGAATLLRRGAGNVAPFAAAPPHGVAVAALLDWARVLADEIDAGDAAATPAPRLVQGPASDEGAPGPA
jgi:hypothetical protein